MTAQPLAFHGDVPICAYILLFRQVDAGRALGKGKGDLGGRQEGVGGRQEAWGKAGEGLPS